MSHGLSILLRELTPASNPSGFIQYYSESGWEDRVSETESRRYNRATVVLHNTKTCSKSAK